MRIIFLDIDGVLNCDIFFNGRTKTQLKKAVKKGDINRINYYKSQICPERLSWLNELCSEFDIKVVLSATMRKRGLEHCRNVLTGCGATFEIIDTTPIFDSNCVRGNEILMWIKEHEEIVGPYYDYKDYVIIDDDSDMLLWQKEHFFQTDTYSGLTPNTCYKIGRFFGSKRFDND